MGLTNNLGKLSNMITSTGSAVGIGTTSPADLLEVRGGFLRISATTGNSPQLNLYSNGQTSNHVTLAQGFATGSDNIGYLYNRANADFVFGTNNVERLRITSTGAVFYSNNGNQTNLLTYSSNQDKGITYFYQAQNFPSSNNYTRILDFVSSGDATGGGAIRFLTSAANTAPATSMLITSGGNVGIGTSSPGCRLDLSGGNMALNDNKLLIRFASDANHSLEFNSGYNGPFLYGYTGAALGYRGTGVIWTSNTNYYNYSNTTTWNQTSDIRIKQNINSIANAIDKILLLNPVTFDYTDEFASQRTWADKNKLNNVGFIAQEYKNVFPDDVDEKEEIVGDITYQDFKTINTTSIVPYLVKAIQEQNQIIQELNERLNKAGL
jgi:hypothetical protein